MGDSIGRPAIFVMPGLSRHPPQVILDAMGERLPCVYILPSARNGTLHVGVTSSLLGRIQQHRDGVFAGFTKSYGVHRLVWYEVADTMEAAIATEKRIKRWRREYKLNLIERDNPDWDDFAIALGLEPLS